ncbi:MAG: 3-deoxy-D-manno-octulosonic acid transferase [Alphaproteobacteria bacterium]|nr:MAG: 3-deoxy-D-manno-octulosonic acid transferase [Alphaproteobacteria bacterium]
MSELWARLALGTYRLVGSATYPFMGPFLAFRARRGKEDRSRRYERYGYPSVERPPGPIVWLHAASVGESMAIIPLIERIDAMGINTIMTTGTVTSAEVVRSRLPQATFHQYVPLDMERAVRRFLDHWKPDLAVFAESEVWPMIILELGARRIPQVLVNARMSDRSYARWSAAPVLAEALFDKISHVVAQSEVDAERFRSMGARPVTVSGNLKVDAAGLPCDEAELARLRRQIGLRPAWIAVSTHAGEEEMVFGVHKAISRKVPDLMTIVVPRHPERGDEVAALAHQAGLTVSRRGAGEPIRRQTDIFLGDTIGEMGLYLRLASVAFMGRSLAASGGQNPLEPAIVGVAVLSGRNIHNFRDSYRNLLAAGGARLVRDERMLAANVEFLLRNRAERDKMAAAARAAVDNMRGALDRTVEVLDSYVFPLTIKRGLEGM